ncbi:MAG: GntR family transcriptional regulator [Actinomycetota bacterium]
MPRTDSVTDVLRTDILAGRFPPGDRLLEIALTERYDCGRAAIRAALVELSSEGLVEREANRGAKVRRISVEEAIQITEARAALESLIAGRAAGNITEPHGAELEDIIAKMRAAVAEQRSGDYSDLNATFHRKVREMSGHAVAADMIDNLRNRAAHHQYRLALMPGRPAESVEQHAAIADAIITGDQDRAATAMHDHLMSVVEILRRWGDAPA